MTGSRRYSQLADIRQRQPSYADNVLAKNIANKIDDPDERNEFLQAVARGEGTFAAKDRSDRFRLRRGAVAALTKAGVHPTEANRIADEEGYSPEVINYHVAQQEGGSSLEDPKARAAENHYRMLLRQATEEADESTDGKPLPETVAKIKVARGFLDSAYGDQYLPQAAPVGVPAGTGTVLRPQAETAPTTPPVASAGGDAEERQMPETPAPSVIPPESEDDPLDLISSGDLSDADLSAAVSRIQESVAKPLPTDTYGEWKARQKDIEVKLKNAQQRHIENAIVRKEVLPAWDAAKQSMAEKVAVASQRLGIPEQQIYNSLAKGEPITGDGRYERAQDRSSIYLPILGGEENAENGLLKKAVLRWDNESFKGAPVRTFIKGVFGDFDVPTNAKVLESLAKERAQGVVPVAPANAAPQQAPKIEVGKPRKVQ